MCIRDSAKWLDFRSCPVIADVITLKYQQLIFHSLHMKFLRSYPQLIVTAALVAIGMLVAKLLLRSVTGSTFLRGDELQDTTIWFVGLVVVFLLLRSSQVRNHTVAEINRTDDSDTSV